MGSRKTPQIIFVTSFNGAMYYCFGQKAIRSFVVTGKYGGHIVAYHENSIESKNRNSGRAIKPTDFVQGVRYSDLFESDADLLRIVTYPQYRIKGNIKDLKSKSDRITMYLNTNAPGFFRKIAAIRQAIMEHHADLLCWVDADVFCRRPLDERFIQFALENDICYLDRKTSTEPSGELTESGVFFFNLHIERVYSFIEAWYQLTASKRIFKLLNRWADHNAFDYLVG